MTGRAPLPERALIDWVRLALAESVGPLTFRRLLQRHGSAAAALDGLQGPPLPGRAEAEDYIDHAARLGVRLLPACDPAYPALLLQIADPPPLLHLAGDAARLDSPAVAVVGARNASALGRRLAAQMAAGLGAGGWTVVSGLARGIDAAAHEAALPTGTIAVMAGGLDMPYPREDEGLYRRLLAEGSLALGEVPLGVQPQARHFPRRNRLISGLSRGIVLVEAALRSGSLITARFAAEQGREVMAMPGSPADPRARGCNALLKEGAILVEDAADVLAVLAALPPLAPRAAPDAAAPRRAAPAAPRLPLPEPVPAAWRQQDAAAGDAAPADLQARLMERLSPQPVAIDLLVRDLSVASAELAMAILELEVAGRVQRHPGNMVSLP